MAKFLRLGADPNAERWTLPPDADISRIQKQIDEAMREKHTVHIQVVLGEDQIADLIVNGLAVEAAVLWETGVQQPTFSIID
jgi:hypothetical protein